MVGFKPPYGRVPVDPPFNLDHYCHDGPMARTVADCALFENAIAGPHPHDVASLRPKVDLAGSFDGIEGMRIALAPAARRLPRWIRRSKPTRSPRQTPSGTPARWWSRWRCRGAAADIMDVTLIHFGAVFGAYIAHVAETDADLMTPYALEMGRMATEAIERTSFIEGLMREAALYTPLGEILERYDVLVCPTVGTRGFVAGDDYADHGVEVGGVTLDRYLESTMTFPFNVASRCPVLAVPSGFADNGVPTGIQIVGRTYDDATVFRVGAAYERVRPWLDTAARRPAI